MTFSRDNLEPGDRVVVCGVEATFRGLNPKIPGDYWVEFDFGGGWWSYDPSNVEPMKSLVYNQSQSI